MDPRARACPKGVWGRVGGGNQPEREAGSVWWPHGAVAPLACASGAVRGACTALPMGPPQSAVPRAVTLIHPPPRTALHGAIDIF